jgi:hypothetical protein
MPATIFRTFPGRMNLVAASRQSSSIFIGNNDRVGIVDTPTGHGFCHLPPFRGFRDRPFPDDDSQGYLHEQFVLHPLLQTDYIALRNYEYANRRNWR